MIGLFITLVESILYTLCVLPSVYECTHKTPFYSSIAIIYIMFMTKQHQKQCMAKNTKAYNKKGILYEY